MDPPSWWRYFKRLTNDRTFCLFSSPSPRPLSPKEIDWLFDSPWEEWQFSCIDCQTINFFFTVLVVVVVVYLYVSNEMFSRGVRRHVLRLLTSESLRSSESNNSRRLDGQKLSTAKHPINPSPLTESNRLVGDISSLSVDITSSATKRQWRNIRLNEPHRSIFEYWL